MVLVCPCKWRSFSNHNLVHAAHRHHHFHQPSEPISPFASRRILSSIIITSRYETRLNRRKWDFSGEKIRPRSFNFDSQGDEFSEEDDDGEGEGDGKWKGRRKRWKRTKRRSWYPDGVDEEKGALEEILDALWIIKVFRSYGWLFPVIILSWLVALGPQAFFTSLALSIGLSAVALVIQFLWRWSELNSKGKKAKRKRRFAYRVSRGRMAAKRDDEKSSRQRRISGYDSWLESDFTDRKLGNDGPSFGGWGDLEEESFSDESQKATGRLRAEPIKSGEETGKETKESLREAEAPLLLRLLVAMFPFLASWTKLFW